MNRRILLTAITVSAVVAVKRFVVGLWFGRQTFNNFGQDLAKVMKQMVLVSSFRLDLTFLGDRNLPGVLTFMVR